MNFKSDCVWTNLEHGWEIRANDAIVNRKQSKIPQRSQSPNIQDQIPAFQAVHYAKYSVDYLNN